MYLITDLRTIIYLIYLIRLFLQELPDFYGKYPANIKSRLEAANNLDPFKQLSQKDINWDSCKRVRKVEHDELPVALLKRKRECLYVNHLF